VIFVTVGTNEAPFDRLLAAVEQLHDGEIVVQHGSSSIRPRNATCYDFLPFERVLDYVRRATAVVMHAGAGSILVALMNGRRPIVVPRLKRFGEAVDDHQLHFARTLNDRGLVTLAESTPSLPVLVAAPTHLHPLTEPAGSSPLAEDLRRYIASVVDRK
jgi:UDP-N-acetylglucosamine transferase subunit ALG13